MLNHITAYHVTQMRISSFFSFHQQSNVMNGTNLLSSFEKSLFISMTNLVNWMLRTLQKNPLSNYSLIVVRFFFIFILVLDESKRSFCCHTTKESTKMKKNQTKQNSFFLNQHMKYTKAISIIVTYISFMYILHHIST